jgi:hypothetical protein
MNPTLKNSTGAIDIGPTRIHLLAPPTAVTKEEGKNCMVIIKMKKLKNSKRPTLENHLSGSILLKITIVANPIKMAILCRIKKWKST